MVDRIDDLVLLLLRCDGKRAAIMSYQEETGVSHARAVRMVERLPESMASCERGGLRGEQEWPSWPL